MNEAWKQVWEDMRQALLGREPEVGSSPASGDQDNLATAQTDDPSSETLTTIELQHKSAALLEPSGIDEYFVDEGATFSQGATSEGADLAVSTPFDAPEQVIAPVHERSQREYLFIAVALLVGMFLFLQSSGLWARWNAPTAPAPDVVATFDNGRITLADLEAHLDLLAPNHPEEASHSPDEILMVVENLVMEELVRRWAAARQPEDEETFTHTMQHITEDLNLQSFEDQLHMGGIRVDESEIQAYYDTNRTQLGEQTLNEAREQIRQQLVIEQEQDYVTKYIDQLKENASITRYFELLEVPAPTEDELRRYYEENREQFTLPRRAVIDELMFPLGEDETIARQDADDALLKLRSGADFATIPQTIPRAVVVTAMPVDEGWRAPEWDAIVFAMTDAEVSDVFRAGDAFYIVQVQSRENARVQTFEEVRPRMEPSVAARVMDKWFAENANKTLFTIKNSRYTVGEFYREYQELAFGTQSQFAGVEGMTALAERLIERLVVVADTEDQLLDIENQPLVEEARLQMLRQMLHQEEVDDKIEVTDEEIQQFYAENLDMLTTPPQARIRYIRIGLGNSEDEAQLARQRTNEAYRKLKPGLFQTGEDFAVVAREYSEDPDTAANGGELSGWIGGSEGDVLTQIERHDFNDVVLSLLAGEISQPFQFGDSLYIVQIIERIEPKSLDIEAARPLIEQLLTQQQHATREAELQQNLLDQIGFEIYWPVLDEYLLQLQAAASSSSFP